MSEFSDSYHLRSNDAAEGVSLLHRAGIGGFVLPSANGWVTVLPEGMPFEPNEQLIAANTGVLLHYIFGEDHAWGIELYAAGELITKQEVSWDPDLEVVHTLSLAEFDSAAATTLTGLSEADRSRLLTPTSHEDIFEFKPAYFFAQAIGLTNFNWLSFEYMSRDQEGGRALPLGVIGVEPRDA